ncbi:EAL domain-containing protein [Marinobacterium sp. MBR-109]|jgi:diguanylate cyclase (GGDEF)-like protein/PAS domain S-box-containing protein|uniref:EAL domain-containing protein n=1 Tax=Marinobacterium sp. MBR-109 TaxID=3156462 RepID=UPI00339151D5
MNTHPRHLPAIKVAAICQAEIISIELGAPLSQAVASMARHHIGSVLVEDATRPVGLLTRSRAMQLVLQQSSDSTLIEAGMLAPVLQVDANLSVDELGLEFISQSAAHAVVVGAAGQWVGIVSQSDIVNSQGLEHDLFLKSLEEITNFNVLRLSPDCSLRRAIERLRSVNYTAMLVGDDAQGWQIMTETDVIRLLAEAVDLDQPLANLALPRLISVDSRLSLYNVRRYFREHNCRHIGVEDHSGTVIGLASYGDILRSVELDYIYRLRELLHDKSRALQQSQHNLRLIERVINASREGIVITDGNGNIQSVNPAFTAITGYEAWEALGRNPSMLSSGRHDRQFYRQLWQTLERDGRWQGEIWNRRKDGSVYPEWLSITAIENDDGKITQYAAIFHDLTEAKRSEARMQQLSWFDSVTGLANRRLFHDRLQMALGFAREQQTPLALLALDLDMFKQINDRFGHSGGDRVLKQIAERIESALQDCGTAARPSGDEFYIMLTELKDETCITACLDRISRALSLPILIDDREVRVRGSMGVAVFPADADEPGQLVRAAEVALQHSKERGRNNICFFSPALHEQTLSRYRINSFLHQALEREEFSLVYQPQICLRSGTLLGVEALIRWDSSELGRVAPDDFIPVAEDTGLIESIGAWVLDQSVRDAAGWLAQGLTLKMSVNFSARQFQRTEVADQVLRALHTHQLPADQFVVELTETSFLHSAERTEREICRLRNQGVRIAIDDFGTGYSSLSYIRQMSLDMLKIDRSFISGVRAGSTDARLVHAMIDMSHAMELTVVAEGIETDRDLRVLRELGCDQAQGYHIARPMRAEELVKWARRYQASSLLPPDDSAQL